LASIDIISGNEGKERRAHLGKLIAQFGDSVQPKRWKRVASSTAIQPLIIGANEEALRVAAGLYGQGLWVPAIRPPTVPAGTARLRVTLSAAHTADEVARLARSLNELEGA
jgi:8-amino-7-oxononanoate synthase